MNKLIPFQFDTYPLQPTEYNVQYAVDTAQTMVTNSINNSSSVLPATVQQYLYSVRRQACRLPDISIATLPIKNQLQPNQYNHNINTIPVPSKCVPELLYNSQFSTLLYNQFIQLRQQMVQYATRNKQLLGAYNTTNNIILPKPKDWYNWSQYCLGTIDNTIPGHPVNINILCQLQQITIRGIIKRFVSIIVTDLNKRKQHQTDSMQSNNISNHSPQCSYISSNHSITELLCIWLYSLLVVLDIPLTPDTSSDLCLLYRTLSSIRALYTADDISNSTVIDCNILMCIIDNVFHQGVQ